MADISKITTPDGNVYNIKPEKEVMKWKRLTLYGIIEASSGGNIDAGEFPSLAGYSRCAMNISSVNSSSVISTGWTITNNNHLVLFFRNISSNDVNVQVLCTMAYLSDSSTFQ